MKAIIKTKKGTKCEQNHQSLRQRRRRWTAAQLRFRYDLAELQANLPYGIHIGIPQPLDDIDDDDEKIEGERKAAATAPATASSATMELELAVAPESGPYKGGVGLFSVKVLGDYPRSPPVVKCLSKWLRRLHPNIDIIGNVCMGDVLRHGGWQPWCMGLSNVAYGLLQLLLCPSLEDPLNKHAAALLRSDPEAFARATTELLMAEDHHRHLHHHRLPQWD